MCSQLSRLLGHMAHRPSLCIDFLSIFCLIYKFSSPEMLWSEAKTSVNFTDTDMDPNILQNKLCLLTRAHCLIDELLFEGRHGTRDFCCQSAARSLLGARLFSCCSTEWDISCTCHRRSCSFKTSLIPLDIQGG